MQQRIAQETGRDSSAMKSIALLTMLFLPSTALAVSFPSSSLFPPGNPRFLPNLRKICILPWLSYRNTPTNY